MIEEKKMYFILEIVTPAKFMWLLLKGDLSRVDLFPSWD